MEVRSRTLRFFFTVSMAFFISAGAFSQAVEKVATGAASYAKALEKRAWNKVLDQTYPKIFEQNGGRQKMLAQAQAFDQDMEQRGFELKKAELSEPLEIVQTAGVWMCVVPMRLTFNGPLGNIYSESSLLAVSENEGKNWTFIDMAQVQIAQLQEIFPHISDELNIPPKRIYQE